MAENKKSFVLYADQRGIFNKLSDEQAGVLIKHIFAYVNDENPKADFVTELAFESIMRQLKRDLNKWSETRQGRSKAGKASAEARRNKKEQDSTNSTNVKSVQQSSTNPTVNVNATVNVNDTDIKNNANAFDLFWSKYPKKVAKDKCRTKFIKLNDTDIKTILKTVDNYIQYKPFVDYTHPNPETYLNQRRWKDEIPKAEEPTLTPTEQKMKTNFNHIMDQVRKSEE